MKRFLAPTPPPYDPLVWDTLPLRAKLEQVCKVWALQGYGTPPAIYVLYAFKVAAYIGGWMWCCSWSPALGGVSDIAQWWSHPIAFQKAILWSLGFEVVGLGCGSGPLTGRYMPPMGGALYWLRPGTTRLPLFPTVPLLRGHRRGACDALAYAALLALLGFALLQAEPPGWSWVALALGLPALGLRDKTIFLAARAEHYWTTVVCLAWCPDPLAAAMAVQLALWFFAGVSKLNHHFAAVVCVMTSNSPVTPFAWLRRRMYCGFPDDLRPSSLAHVAGHLGTGLELGVPLLLLWGDGGAVTSVGLVLMVALHVFITSNVPMGVPIEWNIMVVYGGFVLFGAHPGLQLANIGAPLGAFLVLMLVVVPVLGNVRPAWVSFLLSMRYYAGNWACSVWMFRGDSWKKLERLTKTSPWIFDQLAVTYDHATAVGLVGRVLAFRAMHLHGRALQELVPAALKGGGAFEEYLWLDGELVAGLALGWNFGDGHLHQEQLLEALQDQCGFGPGELRCVFLESQAMFSPNLPYRLVDAAQGQLSAGCLRVSELRARQPWPQDRNIASLS